MSVYIDEARERIATGWTISEYEGWWGVSKRSENIMTQHITSSREIALRLYRDETAAEIKINHG